MEDENYQKRPDNCEACKGVRGNENVMDGAILCDYCSVDYAEGKVSTPQTITRRLIMENLSLKDFLRILSTIDGGDAIELISRFQSGSIRIEGFTVDDFND